MFLCRKTPRYHIAGSLHVTLLVVRSTKRSPEERSSMQIELEERTAEMLASPHGGYGLVCSAVLFNDSRGVIVRATLD
jgi:hypothetical protein